jgi:hypothetical protein
MTRRTARRTLPLLLAAALLCAAACAGTPVENEHVSCTAALSAPSFRRGDTAAIRVVLTPARGIHLNGSPLPSLRFDPGSVVLARGGAEAAVGVNGYLESDVVQHVTIRKDAPRGKHVLRGTLTYYYCSDTEGWCTRYQQALELTLTITR